MMTEEELFEDFDTWEDRFLEAYENGVKFDESLMGNLAWEAEVQNEHDKLRWQIVMESIFQVKNRYFCIDWQKGLTESQIDSFSEQPYEVEKIEREVTKMVVTWVKK